MVLLEIKKSDKDGFLYETKCDTSNEELIRKLVLISNTRIRINAMVEALKQLSMHGPCKSPEDCGIDEILEKSGQVIEKGENYNPDPLGNRTGNAPSDSLKETMEKVAQDALDGVHFNLVKAKKALKWNELKDKMDNIRGVKIMAYPMGLPKYDTLEMLLLDDEYVNVLQGTSAGQQLLDAESAQLWWAGKEFFRDQKVADRVGRNEKTKIIAKLQKRGNGGPQREPAVSEDERKAMMAHYFAKQEEMKKLSQADDDDYLTSSWANPSAMKNQLRGTSNIRPF